MIYVILQLDIKVIQSQELSGYLSWISGLTQHLSVLNWEFDTVHYFLLSTQELSKQIEGHTICALGDAAAWPVQVSNLQYLDLSSQKLQHTCSL